MSEPLTGLPLPVKHDWTGLRPVLERIAQTTVTHLRHGGYVSEDEAAPVVAAYQAALKADVQPPDFLAFVAEFQAKKHSLTMEGEVIRMQKLLRSCLNDRVHYWSFGPLPGRATALYEHCPALRSVCATLGCPASLAGETSIVHVASINPVAAMVASFRISQELNREAEGDIPFVFSFLADLPVWQAMMQRHFAA